MRLIDADAKITALLYDEEHEETKRAEMTIADFLDSHTEEGCPQSGWISVKDRLPQHYDRVPVLIKFKDEDTSDELHFNCLWYVHEPFSNDEKPHWERIGRHEYEVLYWFEIPEPPKDGEQNGKL